MLPMDFSQSTVEKLAASLYNKIESIWNYGILYPNTFPSVAFRLQNCGQIREEVVRLFGFLWNLFWNAVDIRRGLAYNNRRKNRNQRKHE